MSNRVRRLEAADVPQALVLSRAAGWNQVEKDWRLAIELGGDGCFAMECDGVIAATTTSIRYGDQLAWIGMVLTHPEFRRRGFARALMEKALEYVDGRGVRTVKLDATDMGAPLYRELGFTDECAIERWARPPKRHYQQPPSSVACDDFVIPQSLDREAFGADRSVVLDRLAEVEAASVGNIAFAMGRPGAGAAYFGPCVSRSHEAARGLLAWFLTRHPNDAVLWDILPGNAAAVELAREFGFGSARRLTRMARGIGIRQNISLVYAGAGFAFG